MPASGDPSVKMKDVVLLIDEDPQVGQLVRAALADDPREVLISTRIEEGLRLAARHKPGLVLMESRFKGGDGVVLAGKLVAAPATSSSAVVLLAGDRCIARRFRAMQLGVTDVIHKPIRAEALARRLELVRQRLARGRPSAAVGAAVERLAAHVARLVEAGQGAVELSRPGQHATVRLAGGRLEATFGSLSGLAALDAIARIGDWDLPAGRPEPAAAAPFFDEDEQTVQQSSLPPAVLEPMGTPSTVERYAVGVEGDALIDGEDEELETDPALHEPETDPALHEPETDPARPPIGRPPIGRPPIGRPPTGSTVDVLPRAPRGGPPIEALPRARGDGRASTPVEEVPVEGIPVEEVPVEGIPVEEIPVEEIPVEEIPVEEPPVEEIAAAAPQRAPAPLRPWLDRFGRGLLVVTGDAELRARVIDAAGEVGFDAYGASTAVEAYAAARRRRPSAIVADAQLADAAGRELLAAVRCDYLIRETAFVIAPGAELARSLDEGQGDALGRLLLGVEKALTPRVELWQRLAGQASGGSEGGWVAPIGVANLVRMVAARGFSGLIQLRYHDRREAELVLCQGQICEVTVDAPDSSVGPLAMLQLLAYEWAKYLILSEPPVARVPLGEPAALLDHAGGQNNALMERIYREGVAIDGVTLDRGAVDAYMRSAPASSIARMMRVIDGEAPGALVAQGVASPAAIKALLHDMRRKAVLRVESLKPARESGPGGAEPLPALPRRRPPRGRWLVVAVTTLVTVALALVGLAVHRQLSGPSPVLRPASAAVSADASGPTDATGSIDATGSTVPTDASDPTDASGSTDATADDR